MCTSGAQGEQRERRPRKKRSQQGKLEGVGEAGTTQEPQEGSIPGRRSGRQCLTFCQINRHKKGPFSDLNRSGLGALWWQAANWPGQ